MQGRTALMNGNIRGHVGIVEYLLSIGVKINMVDKVVLLSVSVEV
jgi:hypothetical protein